MEKVRRKRRNRGADYAPTRGKMGLRLAICLLLTLAAIGCRVWYPQGVTRAAAVVFGAEEGAVRQTFASLADELAEHGAAEAFAAIRGRLGGRAAH